MTTLGSHPVSQPRSRPGVPLRSLLAAALATALLGLATLGITPVTNEPGWLRWARTAAAHPARTGLALLLVLAALDRRPGGGESVDPAAAARPGGPEELG